ncbi:MFS transporter [Sinomonas albida]|uniref:MFS transporter n=1 Tax=Sinomonas albida TaxID=369942 RepID=UPI001457D9B5|nr:MFS transporter [Sinomonas albida]
MSIYRNRYFVRFWAGEAISVTGAAAASVLLPLLAIETLHANPAWMGIISAAVWLPWLIVGLPAGAWVDALPPRIVMIMANLLGIIAYGSILVAAAFGVLALAQIAAVAFAGGVASVFFRTAYSKLVVALVEVDDRPRANSLLFGTEQAAYTAGPGLGGILAQAFGAALGLFSNVAGLVISTICLLAIKPKPPEAQTARLPLGRAIREGLALVFGDRHLRFFTLTGAAANFGLTGQTTVLTLWLVRDLRLEPVAVGGFLAVVSIGGIAGALAAPSVALRWGDARGTALALTVGAVAMPLYAIAGTGLMAWAAAACVAFGAGGIAASNVMRRSWIQNYVPEHLLGRQGTSAQLVNFGTMPLAAIVAGSLGEAFDLRLVILGMGLIVTAANGTVWAQPWLRASRQLPIRTENPRSDLQRID